MQRARGWKEYDLERQRWEMLGASFECGGDRELRIAVRFQKNRRLVKRKP